MNGTGKWGRRAVWATLAAVLTIGCNPLTLPFVLLRPEQRLPAEYPLRPKEGEKADKDKEVSVVFLTGMTSGVTYEFAGADRELATLLAKKLPEQAKASKEKITVIPPAQVDKFKMANPNWKAMHPAAIGKKLGADYVADLTLASMNVYQPGSANLIYEGRAEVSVDVYETATGGNEPKHRYVIPFVYPRTGMIAVSDKPPSRFKLEFLDQLAQEVVWKHVDHKPTEGIAAYR
jgi:hypothetical protein